MEEEVFWPLTKHKRNYKNHSCSTITDIPDALLIDIFLRLPLKSAKQCSLVSKHWYAIISSPDFAHRFLNFSSKLLIYYIDNKIIRRHFLNPETSAISIFESFSFAFLPSVAEPVSFYKDLVLCYSESVLESESFYYICNPLTRTWIQLPPSPAPHYKWVKHGFLFEGSGCSFKCTLVRIPYNDWEFHKVQIFTSDSGIWSEKSLNYSTISSGFPLFLNSNGVEYQGMLFWIGEDGLIGMDPSKNGKCNRFVDLPPNVSKGYNMSLAVCKESLRLMELKIDLSRDVEVVSICVWDLMDFEKGKWSLKHETSYSGLFLSKSTTWFKDIELINWLACDPNNGDIVYLQMGSSTVVSCNLHKQTMDVVCQIKFDPLSDIFAAQFGFCGAFMYELHWQPTSIHSP